MAIRPEITRIIQSSDAWQVELTLYDDYGAGRRYERQCGRFLSAPMFATAELASAAGHRAVDAFKSTGKFPTLTKAF